MPRPFSPDHIDVLTFYCSNSFNLISFLTNLRLESVHLQSEIHQTKGIILLDSMYVCDHINPLLHQFLSFPRQDTSSPIAAMAEMIRLAAILYLIAVRQSFGIYPTRVTSQIRKLSVLLMTFEGGGSGDTVWENRGLEWLELWVITVGSVLSDEKDKTAWFAERLHAAMRRMSVATYGDLEDKLREFSWIDEIHGTLLRDFRSKLIDT